MPFAIADASGAGSLEPVLNLQRTSLTLSSLGKSRGSTKGSIADIYVEPVDPGWHYSHLDAVVSSGFLAPSGPYNAKVGSTMCTAAATLCARPIRCSVVGLARPTHLASTIYLEQAMNEAVFERRRGAVDHRLRGARWLSA